MSTQKHFKHNMQMGNSQERGHWMDFYCELRKNMQLIGP